MLNNFYLRNARNYHDVDRQVWLRFGNVRLRFWHHFNSNSQVMAGKLVEYNLLETTEYVTAFQTSDWL